MANLSSQAKVRLIIGILLAVGLAVAVFVVVSSGGDDGDGDSASGADEAQVRKTIETFNAGLQAHDTQVVCENSYPISQPPPPGTKLPALTQGQIDDCTANFNKVTPPSNIPDIEVGEISVEKNTATVAVSSPDGTENGQLALVKAGGEWKIAVPNQNTDAEAPPAA